MRNIRGLAGTSGPAVPRGAVASETLGVVRRHSRSARALGLIQSHVSEVDRFHKAHRFLDCCYSVAHGRELPVALGVIADAGWTTQEIARVIPHQANLRIIDAIRERLELPEERMFVNLDKYGNTSAAAIAIALDEANKSKSIVRGDKVVLVVFGAGLTWAAAALEW